MNINEHKAHYTQGHSPRLLGSRRVGSANRNCAGIDFLIHRMTQAGNQVVNWFSVACELHRDWRNDVKGLGTLLGTYIPAYQNLMTSYDIRR